MKVQKEIRLYSRTPGQPQITISVENDQITSIRRDQRFHKDFPLKMGWNLLNHKVIHDLKTWLDTNGYYKDEHITGTIISPLEFAMGKIPANGKFKIR